MITAISEQYWYCMISIVFILLKGNTSVFLETWEANAISSAFPASSSTLYGYGDVQGEWEFSEREAQIVVGPALHLTFQKSETTASNFSLSLVDTGGRRTSALIPGVGLQRLEPERSLKEGRRPFLPLIVQLVAFSWLTLFTFRSCLFSPHLAIKV